jgi:hypothetical protein
MQIVGARPSWTRKIQCVKMMDLTHFPTRRRSGDDPEHDQNREQHEGDQLYVLAEHFADYSFVY